MPAERHFDWAACGTPKQYRKHLRHKIPPCTPCLEAEARRQQDDRRTREERRLKEIYRQYRVKCALRGQEPLGRAEWLQRQAPPKPPHPRAKQLRVGTPKPPPPPAFSVAEFNRMIRDVNDNLRGMQWRQSHASSRVATVR